ncbi:hypothetical protein QBC37DRAFT_430336 [Rhypophila decipiens]|uniref:Archaemetzincin-2 n=1 Tax=Rhypophila decipiens TaxID=261697 RepID=A0AAN7B4B5_9PEZI|nr:hypothetical protein QBC37DRAFT_430336 [Rhypophila decipiens]
MASKRKTGNQASCQHAHIQVDVSSHASEVGFTRVPAEKRVAATTPSGRVVKVSSDGTRSRTGTNPPSEYTFPAPLVLPGDSLSIDPKEAPQSLRSFIQEGARNPLTNARNTLYVGRVSGSSSGSSSSAGQNDISQITKSWAIPCCISSRGSGNTKSPSTNAPLEPPRTEDIIEYMSAYYHPLQVKSLLPASSKPASFVPWQDDETTDKKDPRSRRKGAKVKATSESSPTYVGLHLGEGVTRIRTRPCPDDAFPRQINLNDVLDALLEAIPSDAHSAILLVDQDMYDDDDDTFCCGLAYGGSRVAVVSTARYHPALDSSHYDGTTIEAEDLEGLGVDRAHMWPGSHCQEFVRRVCEANLAEEAEDDDDEEPPKRKKAKSCKGSQGSAKGVNGTGSGSGEGLSPSEIEKTPMGAAIRAALAVPSPEDDLSGLWFSWVARTAAHELGHCFALGHCVYYACSMQGTSCLAEDIRQPPYLCPICLAKLTRATLDVAKEMDPKDFVMQRYKALLEFCGKRKDITMFAGFYAWLERRIAQLNAEGP